MPITQGMPDMDYLRQHRLIRNVLIGGAKWIQGHLPDHAVIEDVQCADGKYTLRITIELLDADLMKHFERQRAETKSFGQISLKAVA